MNDTELVELLDGIIEQSAFSGVVTIQRRGAPIYARAAGYADRSNRVANTLDTRFGIASGTKFFTALAIGRLVAAGRLTLSTKLHECVALDFPHYSPDITIAHLLSHTSGIADYLDEEKIDDFDNIRFSTPYYDLKGPRDYLAIFADEPMKFAPGARFSYSNGGYILLGVVIEAVTGARYQDFVAQEVFQPAGMQRTGFFAMNRLPEQTAFGYIEDADGWRTNIFNLPIIGASDGGAFTTAGDVALLWDAFWSGRILPLELVEQYASPQVFVEADPPIHYGYGLWIRGDAGVRRDHYITGGDAGVSFQSIVNRAQDLQTTVISNTGDGVWPVLQAIREYWSKEQG
jgi:CubicO group peptidase (beta-lactamase class C family)